MGGRVPVAKKGADLMKKISVRIACGLAIAAFIAASGCATGPKTTRYQAADFEFATGEVVQQLLAHSFIQSRDEDSPPIRLMPFELENQSSDRLSRVDQWAAVARVFLNPDVLALFSEKNIDVVFPEDAVRRLDQFGVDEAAERRSAREPATHAIRAVFMASTRTAGEREGDVARARRDNFIIEYSIAEADSGRIVWSGQTEYSRYAHGVLAD
jgi:hypothetical protein